MPQNHLPVSEFASVASAWDAINQEYYNHPLLESQFIGTAVEYLGTGNETIAICGNSKRPDAIAIFAPKQLGRRSTFQPSQSPLGALITVPGLNPSNLKEQLFELLPASCQNISITQQDPDLVPRPESHPTVDTLDYIKTARITVDSSFDDYWAKRGKNLRHNMKRQRNRLEREGTSQNLEILKRPEDMRMGVQSYGELESRGWKSQGGSAVHLDNDQGRFYAALLENYATSGNARIYRYFYNEKLSAVDLCIFNNSTLVILKTTYDEAERTSSPALLMRHAYFPEIFDRRLVKRIEFYGKVMDWHTKWSDEVRMLYHINAYRSTAAAKIHKFVTQMTSRSHAILRGSARN